MKKLFGALSSALILILTLDACNYANFDRYPGNTLNTIPEKFQGTFYSVAEKKSANNGDDTTFAYIGSDHYQEFKGKDLSQPREKRVLGKDFQVCEYKNLNFLAVYNEDDSLWNVFVMEPTKNGFIMKTMPEITSEQREGKSKEKGNYIKYFKEKTKIKPTGEVVWYYEMDEEQLYKCYKKKLRKLDGIQFIRIR